MNNASIFSELLSIQLTIIGISFSIFTIIFSLIVGKIDSLNLTSKQIKNGNRSPEIMQTETFCKHSISNLKKLNRYVIIICLLSLFLSALLWCLKFCLVPYWIQTSIIILNYIDFIGIIVLIISVFHFYVKNTKIY